MPFIIKLHFENDGEMEITLISVKDKVSSTLSASFNFVEKLRNRPISNSNQVS